MTRKSNECAEYIYNAKILIPRYHAENKQDSIEIILDYVDSHCGSEAFFPVRTLSQIASGANLNDFCDSILIQEIIYGPSYYRRDSRFFEYLIVASRLSLERTDPPSDAYTKFLQQWAETLIPKTDSNTVAYLICQYFANKTDSIYRRLAHNDFPGTCIQAEYDKQIEYWKSQLGVEKAHASIFTGIWIPQGASKSLGNKIELGLQLGTRIKRFGGDITGTMRFLSAKEQYTVKKGDEVGSTTRFLGGYIGVEGTLLLIRSGRYDTEVFGGIGYDGFGDSRTEASIPKGVNAFNSNIGLTQRLFKKGDEAYCALQVRYNFVDYVTHGGSDLSGNTLSVDFIFGFISQPYAREQLQKLGYHVGRQ